MSPLNEASSVLKSQDLLSVGWPWPLTFWVPWNWCAMSAAAWTTFLPITKLLRLFFVELRANTREVDDVTSLPWRLIFEVIAQDGDEDHHAPSMYQVHSSLAFRFLRYGLLSATALIDLVTLTFDLLVESRVLRCQAPVSWQFSACYTPFRSWLMISHWTNRQTDRQTTVITA